MGTIETAKESERGVVDIETLQHTNQCADLTRSTRLLKIQEDGTCRSGVKPKQELGRIEGELKQKLLEVRK